MKKLFASTILAAGLFAFAGSAQAEDCGSVSIAEMNWASAGVAAHVDKIILENGYGCTVTLVTGDTMPTFTSMNEKGEPDVAPEMWVNAVRTPLDAAMAEGRLLQLVPLLSEGGVEGWWIPKFLADKHPDIKTVQDALKHPELFPAPEDASKGAVRLTRLRAKLFSRAIRRFPWRTTQPSRWSRTRWPRSTRVSWLA